MKHCKRKARGNKRLLTAFISDYSRLCLLIPLTYWVNFKSLKLFTLNKNISIYAQKFYLLQIWYYFTGYIYVILWIFLIQICSSTDETQSRKKCQKIEEFLQHTSKITQCIKTVRSLEFCLFSEKAHMAEEFLYTADS